jgi:sulfur carrier protein
VQVFLNGQPRDIPEASTITQLLESLDLSPRQVAVEVNLELVPRGCHAEHVLQVGDRLEVVTLVGGG